jgi:hypothetical protein
MAKVSADMVDALPISPNEIVSAKRRGGTFSDA